MEGRGPILFTSGVKNGSVFCVGVVKCRSREKIRKIGILAVVGRVKLVASYLSLLVLSHLLRCLCPSRQGNKRTVSLQTPILNSLFGNRYLGVA